VFENTATEGDDPDTTPTNTTYHRLALGKFPVTEQYFLYEGGVTTDKMAEDRTSIVSAGSYTAQGADLTPYVLRGYDIGYGYVEDDTLPTVDSVSGPMTIKLYYHHPPVSNATVTIHYVDESGSTPYIKTSVEESAFSGSDYYLPMRHLAGFDDWNYFNFSIDAHEGAKTPYATPVYPPGTVAGDPEHPTIGNITGDHFITLYFTHAPAVTVYFAEYGNPSNILKAPQTYFSGSIPSVSDLTGSIDLTSVNGKTYSYADAYSIDGGSVATGAPSSLPTSGTITLYFSTTFTVTEMFIRYDEDGEAITLSADVVTPNLPRGYSFSGNPPASINGYSYTGYQINTTSGALSAGNPSLIVDDDYIIIYVYAVTGGYGGGDDGGGTPPPTDEPPPPPPA
jgi:hypothetical protein